ncbi:probable tRNA (uracil-O(2)-)-methyltransferase isoform X1 [Polypterus senegalus]|uniref:probable tRNA (uracil-O(2)-)-methyltransferase isoform X1 n=1 Tax=Polypterus senegalus TaxID=55291 RepID=UPI001964EC5D|nr:probable tRNA (uracil-O(2)-)-methyltransferase isoform X1 [Polypterus senegalus]
MAACEQLKEMAKVAEETFRDHSHVLPDGFWSAVDVWIHKPHVINKRLCGVQIEESGEVPDSELEDRLTALCYSEPPNIKEVVNLLKYDGVENMFHRHENKMVIVRTLIPKVNNTDGLFNKEIIVKDPESHCVTFLPLESNEGGSFALKKSNIYQIQLKQISCEEWSVLILAMNIEQWYSDAIIYPKCEWLGSELLPKIIRWSTEIKRSEFKSTLSLIPMAKYGNLYQQLKEKYKEMVKVWPEVTDPEKFVYEDVAIATYLLVMWEEERKEKGLIEKQSFVDLGCGNGLLVHILSNEGHSGKGIDVRKRKIWDLYGKQTCLEECAIIPSDSFLFPNFDWLIGNHSDELTPWIPVIASRSSYSCRYFVLPCCFFDFHGKYCRRQCKKTQYREYIDFITEVGSVCGFHVEEDCLRIPSTKRVCLIGKSRTYEMTREQHVEEGRKEYINSRWRSSSNNITAENEPANKAQLGCKVPNSCIHNVPMNEISPSCVTQDWVTGFQAREKVEQTRNCASLPRAFIDEVVLKVAKKLLDLNKEQTNEEGKTSWNRGGSLTVREIAELLDQHTLQTLKNECGGLQTLLKNNHQVFQVLKGRVQLRDWREEAGMNRIKPDAKRKLPSEVFKTRLCWFFINHPDGCPILAETCQFAHGSEELRPSLFRNKKIK